MMRTLAVLALAACVQCAIPGYVGWKVYGDSKDGRPALPSRINSLQWCAVELVAGKCPDNAALFDLFFEENHLWSYTNDVALFRASVGNEHDARKGSCRQPLFHSAVNLHNITGALTVSKVDQWGNTLDFEISKLTPQGNQTCFVLGITVTDKNKKVVVDNLRTASPTIPGLSGGNCADAAKLAALSNEEFIAETKTQSRSLLGYSDDYLLAAPRRKRAHNLGERPSYHIVSQQEHTSRVASRRMGSRASAAETLGSLAASNQIGNSLSAAAAAAPLDPEIHVANSTDNGYRFNHCSNSSAPGDILFHQECSYEWDTCPVNNFNYSGTAKGCQHWYQTAETLAAPNSDRELIRGELYYGIEERTGPNPDDVFYCEIWITSGDFVAETIIKSSYATQPDPITGYTTNMTYSLLWGNASTPCVCTSFQAKAQITVNTSIDVFPASEEYCNPHNCAPWNPTPTPSPSNSPSTSPVPEKKKGMSTGTKIAIAAAAGGGALLLGGGAAVMFFKKKPAAEGSSLIGNGKGTSYSALS